MTTISYPGMPYGEDWIQNIPVRYKHGKNGFDERIMRELAGVGVPCYTLDDLANGPRTIPPGIPIFIDWLANLESKIPGPETEHRLTMRKGLIRNLIDPAARGNRQAIDLLIAQLRRQPPLPEYVQAWACVGLQTIAGPKNFPQIKQLLGELTYETPKSPLVQYLGKVKTPEARDLAITYLDQLPRAFAIKALVQMKATGVRHLVEPLLADEDAYVRKAAKRAMEQLPADD